MEVKKQELNEEEMQFHSYEMNYKLYSEIRNYECNQLHDNLGINNFGLRTIENQFAIPQIKEEKAEDRENEEDIYNYKIADEEADSIENEMEIFEHRIKEEKAEIIEYQNEMYDFYDIKKERAEIIERENETFKDDINEEKGNYRDVYNYHDVKEEAEYTEREEIKENITQACNCQTIERVINNRSSFLICPEIDKQNEALPIKITNVRSEKITDNSKPYFCKICNYKTAYRKCLLKHLKNSHKKVPEHYIKMKVYLCDDCDYKGTNRKLFIKHIKSHESICPFICYLCEKPFKKSHQLEKHMKSHNKSQLFLCLQRTGRFQDCEPLVQRKKTIQGDGISCTYCSYKSTSASALAIHIRKHTGEKPFGCEICDYKCTSKSSLVRHARTHTYGGRSFQCHQCDYKTYNNINLTIHQRKHW